MHSNDIKAVKAIARINAYNLGQMAEQNILISGVAKHCAENLLELVRAIDHLEEQLAIASPNTKQPTEAIA